jgi:hypothetical protein
MIVPFQGWSRNALLRCGEVEMIVTLEVGPRVLRLGFEGEENLLAVHEKDAGTTSEDTYHSYGGHRLWIAPEEPVRTMQPDNWPVEHEEQGDWHVFRARPDTFHTQKEIRILAEPALGRYRLVHRIYNHSPYDLELAPWTPTQCAPGGECLIPQAPYQSHRERLLPTRPLVMWGYTRLSDPRWTWGDRVVRLRHAPVEEPTKIGTLVEQGVAVYVKAGFVFLKRFPFEPSRTYPDFNSNFEAFTRHDMLEVESLGPMQTVPPGGYAQHFETWYVFRDPGPPGDDDGAADWLERLAASRPL